MTGDLFGLLFEKRTVMIFSGVSFIRGQMLWTRSGMTFQSEDGDVPTVRGPKADTPLISGCS